MYSFLKFFLIIKNMSFNDLNSDILEIIDSYSKCNFVYINRLCYTFKYKHNYKFKKCCEITNDKIKKFDFLTYLNLKNCYKILDNTLSCLTNLKKLDLTDSYNYGYDNGINYINGDCFKYLVNLEELILSGNNCIFIKNIINLKNLKKNRFIK